MIGWVIFLFVVGMVLILSEFIVPGGICGVLGGLLLLVSCGLGWYHYPDEGVLIVIGEILGAIVTIGLGMYILSRSRAGKFLVLEDSQQADAGWVASESDESLVGAAGRTFTKLRPAGTIVVDGKRIGAVTEGGYIDRDAAIRVIAVHGNRVVVEQVENE